MWHWNVHLKNQIVLTVQMLVVASYQQMHWPYVCGETNLLCNSVLAQLKNLPWTTSLLISYIINMWSLVTHTPYHPFHSLYYCFTEVFLSQVTILHTSSHVFLLDDKCCYPLQVSHDVDGSGNYLLLTHRHVAHLHPFSSYLCRLPCPNPPSWVLYHEFTISRDNCIRIASEVHPQMWVKLWGWLRRCF